MNFRMSELNIVFTQGCVPCARTSVCQVNMMEYNLTNRCKLMVKGMTNSPDVRYDVKHWKMMRKLLCLSNL